MYGHWNECEHEEAENNMDEVYKEVSKKIETKRTQKEAAEIYGYLFCNETEMWHKAE